MKSVIVWLREGETSHPPRIISFGKSGKGCSHHPLAEVTGGLGEHPHTIIEETDNEELYYDMLNSYPGFSSVVHEEPHLQMTGTLSYRPEETGGRQREKSLDTPHRRLDDRYRVLPWPEDCTVVVCLHDALYGVYL
ncbi:hypothetical protein TNCV_4231441 [Trichonephila clavipes]|uniref:Uncharacterized protein n=1 Tax=Trichonephila clavipes TaxID=2585209 RepID=A0A8X6VM93_TRICX|nr:hypothetical protein TNCV_4231441 [Trichonephila clavipes]